MPKDVGLSRAAGKRKCHNGNSRSHRNSGKDGALPHESVFPAVAADMAIKVIKTGYGIDLINLPINML